MLVFVERSEQTQNVAFANALYAACASVLEMGQWTQSDDRRPSWDNTRDAHFAHLCKYAAARAHQRTQQIKNSRASIAGHAMQDFRTKPFSYWFNDNNNNN